MRIVPLLGAVMISLQSCAPPIEQGAFLTYLGSDTLAAEQFTVHTDRIEASVMLRTPETSLQEYALEFDDEGNMRRFEATVRDPASPEAPPRRKDLLQASPGGFILQVTEGGETRIDSIDADATALPFLDMIHWPFEVVLERAHQAENDVFEQPLLVGTRAMPFEVRRLSADSMSIKHPFRGTMGVTVDAQGRLQLLDAGQTTRKLRVMRKDQVDVEALAAEFAAREADGRAFGPLSGRQETTVDIQGATVTVDYGTPSKRGREIFGALVPYGEIWRTGANQATHFTTDTGLVVGGLDVPPGTYTLYTIPRENSCLLIINRQTGQGGTTYYEDRDLGRVEMRRDTLNEMVEVFTIAIEENDRQAELQLKWDQTAYTVPFTVKN